MANKVDKFWCWLTGFWEADGSVFVYCDKKGGRQYSALRVDLSQKELSLLKRIRRELKVRGIVGSLQPYSGKDGCYNIRLSTRQAERFVKNIYPYVQSDRKRQRIKTSFKKVNASTHFVKKYSYKNTKG